MFSSHVLTLALIVGKVSRFQFDHNMWSFDRNRPQSRFISNAALYEDIGKPIVEDLWQGERDTLPPLRARCSVWTRMTLVLVRLVLLNAFARRALRRHAGLRVQRVSLRLWTKREWKEVVRTQCECFSVSASSQ